MIHKLKPVTTILSNHKSPFTLLVILMIFLTFAVSWALITPDPVESVPSFTRQTGMTCAACHMQPPRLTEFGREFKMSGYTQTSAEMTHDGSMLQNLPISARLRGDVNWTADDDFSFSPAEATRLYVSGRMTENLGLHAQVLGGAGVNAQVTYAKYVGDALLGFSGGNVGPGRSDPFDSYSRGMGYTRDRNMLVDRVGDRARGLTGAMRDRSVGGMVFARYPVGIGQLYGSVGLWDVEGAGSPGDPMLRGAYELDFAGGYLQFGSFYYTTREVEFEEGTSQSNRYGVDINYQTRISGPWLLDVATTYLAGKNEQLGLETGDFEVDHSGFQLHGTLHRGPVSFGINYGRYEYDAPFFNPRAGDIVDPHDNSVVNTHISWMFAPNARLGLDWSMEDYANESENVFRLRYDIGF